MPPTDIVPNINSPVVHSVWTGLLSNDMCGRIYDCERALKWRVGDIEPIEPQALDGYGRLDSEVRMPLTGASRSLPACGSF